MTCAVKLRLAALTSRSDPAVFLFYVADGTTRWVSAVVRRGEQQGFLITAYLTDAILWPK